jgi:GntR family transcriptional repressor for pyruvate dehydrogenase complex
MNGPIGPVEQIAAYELVVEQIRRAIRTGRFLPGEKLPPERDLAQQLGVSRTTIREAARVLEGEGLINVRRGAGGGLVIVEQEFDRSRLREELRARFGEVEDILDFRVAVESQAARLAALRRTEDEIDQLRALLARMDRLIRGADTGKIAGFGRADSEFHLGIARASRNSMLIKAVEDARAAMFLPIGAVFKDVQSDANDIHEEVLEAVECSDPDAAGSAMTRHVELTRAGLRSFARLERGRSGARQRG